MKKLTLLISLSLLSSAYINAEAAQTYYNSPQNNQFQGPAAYNQRPNPAGMPAGNMHSSPQVNPANAFSNMNNPGQLPAASSAEISFANFIHQANNILSRQGSQFRHKVYTLNHPDYVVVISLDGGGVRGIIPAVIIDYIEKVTGKRITEIGDVFAGTSAGSIVAAFLNLPNANGKQLYSASDAMNLAGTLSSRIFKNSVDRTLKTVFGVIRSKYSAKPLEDFLQKYAGQAAMRDTVRPTIITSVDGKTSEPYLFSTSAAYMRGENFKLSDAVRASTAAPSYSKPHHLKLPNGQERVLIDGGVSAMSPELQAYSDAVNYYPNKKVIMLSIATGHDRDPFDIWSKGDFGGSAIGAVKLLVRNATIWQQLSSNQIMHQLSNGLPLEYYRIEVTVLKENASLDDASLKNLNGLKSIGLNTASCNHELNKFLNSLKEKGIIQNLMLPPYSDACKNYSSNSKGLNAAPRQALDPNYNYDDEKIDMQTFLREQSPAGMNPANAQGNSVRKPSIKDRLNSFKSNVQQKMRPRSNAVTRQ